jgi:nitrate/nitrite-specific signal transduction histidine kinase
MHERSQEINAHLEIDSKLGGGTEVIVHWKESDSKGE